MQIYRISGKRPENAFHRKIPVLIRNVSGWDRSGCVFSVAFYKRAAAWSAVSLCFGGADVTGANRKCAHVGYTREFPVRFVICPEAVLSAFTGYYGSDRPNRRFGKAKRGVRLCCKDCIPDY